MVDWLRLFKAIGIVAAIVGIIAAFCFVTVLLFELWGVLGVMVPFGIIFVVGIVSLIYQELE